MEREETKEITKAEAGALRRELQQATQSTNEAWWRQAELLHQVYYSGIGGELKPVFETWGYETFHDYVENELGLHVGTARSMVSTAHFYVVRMKGAFSAKQHLLSRQRMRALACYPNKVKPENFNNWVTMARNMTVCALEHKLEGRHEHVKKFSLSLSESDYALIKEALDQLMATGSYDNRGKALLAILRPSKVRKAG